ncbi:Caseinolytic peptidase B -like protein [Trichinella pseudospiralis]|uniref:Ragulator complex protein LAMTOR2 homolog n=1 Tax=Trichinella pseudospiralis TaxID=6337 RepID=A0A0V1KF49_TRIPS|nr:Caseinolytic peptidase B -like protein [Trichinella pseudospiralis]
MIRPTVLNSILCQANAEGVTGTLLMNREGMVLCHAGCDESQAEAIAAIASNIWCSYEKSGQETFRDDKLKWFFLEGSEGRIAICKVSTLLLCMVANDTVEIGMLRGKLYAVKHCLEPKIMEYVFMNMWRLFASQMRRHCYGMWLRSYFRYLGCRFAAAPFLRKINAKDGWFYGFTFYTTYEFSGMNGDRNHGEDIRKMQLMYAAKDDDERTIKKLLQSGVDPNERHFLGWTALHVASFHGSCKALKVLLENGADVNTKDNFSNVQTLARDMRISFLEVLFIREEFFNFQLNKNIEFQNMTPLHYAVLGNNKPAVEMLMEYGADPLSCNASGQLPVNYAQNQQIEELLKGYTKKYTEKKALLERLERQNYPFEERVKKNMIGQDGAISSVASENGWTNDEHPLVFLFLGSSGVGKTELAKQVAQYLYKDNKKSFIRIDMSEYQEKHEVAKFIGSPPGYVGHQQGGQLTKSLTECPNAVVLFDEVEKAHPDVLTIMLQLFDEGRLTDGMGKTVDCKEAIFIMTSNLAAEEIASHALKLRKETADMVEKRLSNKLEDLNEAENVTISRKFKETVVQPILKRHLKRDEFIGRITEIVYFLPFSRPELLQLVTLLADGYNVRYGARSIKHEIERQVVSKLAAAHERSLINDGSEVRISATLPPGEQDRSKSIITIEVVNSNNGKSETLSDQILKMINLR